MTCGSGSPSTTSWWCGTSRSKTAGSPFEICGAITPAYAAMKGLKVGKGWNKKIKELFAGTHGCTHHTEMLGAMATVAFQTIFSARNKWKESDGASKRPPLPQHLPRLRHRRRDREEELAGVLYRAGLSAGRSFESSAGVSVFKASAWTPGLEFIGQDLVDAALAVDARLALEGGRDDLDAEVRLAAGAVAGMALVQLRFVDDAARASAAGRRSACFRW